MATPGSTGGSSVERRSPSLANKRYQKPPSESAPATGHPAPSPTTLPDKVGPRPGLPGKTQGNDYSAGMKDVKQYPDSEGI